MKISLVLFAAAAQADERKVPPRTPPQRLYTLKRFMKEWVTAQIAGTINRPGRAAKMISRGVERLEGRMSEARDKACYFFDPKVPHGGPDPNRNRRSSDWVDAELSRIQRDVNDNEELDFFDQYFAKQAKEASQERGLGASGDVEVQSMDIQFQERLSIDQDLAWKQIGTGFRKWILRYISECNGQRENYYHTTRLAKIHGSIQAAYETVYAAQSYEDSY